MTLDFGDGIAIVEGVALAGSWIWLQTKKRSFPNWRQKAALGALVCASLAVVSDLLLTGIMHLRGPDAVGAGLYLSFLGAFGTTSLASLILGIVGRGSPRVLALVWSLILLAQAISTVAMAIYQ